MKFFTVHENPDRPDPDDRVILVKEGWSWPALVFPVLWLLHKRAWAGLGLYALASVVLLGLFAFAGVDETLIEVAAGALLIGMPATLVLAPSPFLGGIGALFAALCAYEAGDVHRFMLGRRGYRVTAIVSGKTRIEAEQAYFSAHPLPGGGAPGGPWGAGDGSGGSSGGGRAQTGDPAARRAGQWASDSEPILGLFPGPDRRG